MNILAIIVIILILIIFFWVFFYYFSPGYSMMALVSGVRISLVELFLMRIRKLPVHDLVVSIIVAAKGGVIVDRNALQAHAMAGGDVKNVIEGMVRAKHLGLKLPFKKACEADFRGIDLADLVKKAAEKEQPNEKFLNH